MIGIRLASVLVSTAAFALAAGAVQAQRQPIPGATEIRRPPASPRNNTLRCVRSSEGRVTIYNGGPAVLPKGTDILVYAKNADGAANGTGGVPTDVDLAVGQSWLEPIKFGKEFTNCEAKITNVPGY